MTFSTIEEMIEASAGGIRPPERLTVAEAAERYRYLNNPGSYVGYWDNTMAPYLVEPMEVLTSLDYIGMVFAGPARTGKALDVETPILTPFGWSTMGALEIGDSVFDEAWRPVFVTAVSEVMVDRPCYRVHFDDWVSPITADEQHLWVIASGRVLTTVELEPGMVIRRKGSRWKDKKDFTVARIIPVESVPVKCIQVSGQSKQYLAGVDCVPTHNSDMFFNWLTYTARNDPADMMHVLMTQSVARDWSQKDLRRAFRHSKELGSTVAPGRHNQSTHSVRFLSGMHLLVKWPTITELSGKTVGRNWISDYDRIPESIDGEGNAYDLTAKRGQTFRRNAMTVAESSPGFDIEDPKWMAKTPHEAPPSNGILALYNRGDRRIWYWRCPHCAEAFEPHFKYLRWPDSKDHVEAAEEAFMVCPHCGGITHHDTRHGVPGKHELNQSARWVQDGMIWTPAKEAYGGQGSIDGKPYRSDIASFWLKGPAASFTTWRDLVLKYLKANEEYERTGSQEALKTTVNTDQGMPFIPKGLESGRTPEVMKALAKDLGERVVPNGVRFLVATIDVQGNRFVVQVHGIGKGGDITVIDRFAIKKSERLDEDGERERVKPASYVEDWKLLIDGVIKKTYPLADDSGRRMGIFMTGCDSGGKADTKNDSSVTKNAYQFWRELRDAGDGLHRKFLLLKGGSSKTAPRVQLSHPDSERKDRSAGARGEIPVLMLNTTALKDQLNVMLDRLLPEGGMVHFPDWLPDWFWSELCAEVRQSDKWEKVSNRNEAWDLLVYVIALCLYRPIKIEHLDWDNPPAWADEWDENETVVWPEEEKKVEKKETTLADLASLLA